MNNAELKKNAEGYADPTASATLSKPDSGDIWAYNGGVCLIIKNHGKFSTILMLESKEKHPNQVEIMTQSGPMYADQRLISYGLHVKMGRYIETVGVEELDRALGAIEDALGITLLTVDDIRKAAGQEATDQEASKLRTECAELLAEVERLNYQLEFMTDLHSKAVKRVNQIVFAKMKVEHQLELLQSMVGGVLAHFRVDTELDTEE